MCGVANDKSFAPEDRQPKICKHCKDVNAYVTLLGNAVQFHWQQRPQHDHTNTAQLYFPQGPKGMPNSTLTFHRIVHALAPMASIIFGPNKSRSPWLRSGSFVIGSVMSVSRSTIPLSCADRALKNLYFRIVGIARVLKRHGMVFRY